MKRLIAESLCYLDPARRMAGECPIQPEIGRKEEHYIVSQIRILNGGGNYDDDERKSKYR